MRGLRTNEGAKFEKYFAIIEEEARGCREISNFTSRRTK